MTVNELLAWCQAQEKKDEEVMVRKGPVVGFGYLDEDELQLDDENAVDGIHPWLK